ncbi:glycosyltransferase [Patescibacteria group bacterium]|nr:glycosyltransferase [Patescibacteria group bacterium]
MKVALVHDFLNQVGGAEKVLQVFHELFPKAPIYTITHDPEETYGVFKDLDIRTSFIQNLPFGIKRYKWYLSLMPAAIESLDLTKYDVVISDSSAYAKGVITSPNSLHLCYCHSPTRYLWSDTHDYTEELKQPSIIKQALPVVLSRIRLWDRLAADRVDSFVANSEIVQKRIKKYYQRGSKIIYPPVDTDRFSISDEVEDYYLIVSRLRPYKRVDLAIQAFNALEYPLKIIGAGEETEKLKKMAGDNIEFLGPLSNDKVAYYLSRCKAFIHPQEEDFGIAALEAMASGRPVIAYKAGGAKETIIEGKTGEFFEEQMPWDIVDVIRDFDASKYNPQEIRNHALQFDTAVFKAKMKEYFEQECEKHFQAKR